MRARPWIVLGAMFLAFVANVALVASEDLPEGPGDATTHQGGPIDELTYVRGNRAPNLQRMGLDAELVDEAVRQMSAMDDQLDRLRLVLEQDTAATGAAFCGQDLPPPYAALGVLLVQDNDRRSPISPDRLTRLEQAPFFDRALVRRLHEQMELSSSRKEQATVMAVGAVMTSREGDALDGVAPFSQGRGRWGLPHLEALDPSVRPRLATYFATMHVMTELANEPVRGVCR